MLQEVHTETGATLSRIEASDARPPFSGHADCAAGCEPASLNVLVVESDAAAYRQIWRRLMLMASHEPRITHAGTIAAARFALRSDEFDAVVVSGALCEPDTSGLLQELAICRAGGTRVVLIDGDVRQGPTLQSVPRVGLTTKALVRALAAARPKA